MRKEPKTIRAYLDTLSSGKKGASSLRNAALRNQAWRQWFRVRVPLGIAFD
jgi:hypothetical protein